MPSIKTAMTLDKGYSRFNTVRHTLGASFIGRRFDSLVHHLADIPSTNKGWEWSRFCALVAAAIGFVGLIGWLCNIPIMAQGHQGFVLLAPRAAVLFLCLGAASFYYLKNPDRAMARTFIIAAGTASIGVGLLNTIQLPWVEPLLEPVLLRNISVWEYVYRDRMAPLDVYTFLALGPGVILFPFRARLPRIVVDLSGTVFLLALLIHSTILQGYIYGSPVFYDWSVKPVELLAAAAFCALSIGFILTLGVDRFPLRPLAGPAVRARLFRTFLPVGVASIFIYSLLLYTVFRKLNPAFAGSLSAIIATVVVTILVARSSRVVSSQVERAVRETEKQFGVIVESVKDYSIFMMDPQGTVVTWNGGAERVKGYKAEEVIGKHYSVFYPPEDREKGKPNNALLRALELGSFQEEGWRLRKDGSLYWAEVFLTAIHDESGYLLGFSKVERDISERRHAEETLRQKTAFIQMLQTVTSAANDASSLEEAMGICMAHVCRQLGWQIGHGLRLSGDRNKLISASWHIEPGARLEAFKDRTDSLMFQAGYGLPGLILKTGKPAWISDLNRDIKFLRKDAAKAAGLIAGCAFPILSGTEVVGVLEFFSEKAVEPNRDLYEIMVQVGTQLGRVAERQKTEAHIRASLREKEVLLKEIHHRVKNNLQVISSLLRLQSEHVEDPRMTAMLQESQDRIRSMSLIHECLYQSEDLAHLQFSDYIRSLVSNLQTSYGIAPETLKVSLEIEPLRLDIDTAIPCGLIVTELVSNALKHAFPVKNKDRDELVISFKEQTAKTYHLRVKDNGVGIPADLDVDKTRSLGLRLVRALTQQLGGELQMKRSGGTEYSIVFTES